MAAGPQTAHYKALGLQALSLLWLLAPEGLAFELSCANARVPSQQPPLEFCNMVAWRSAVAYSHINYTEMQMGPMLSDQDQARIAQMQYEDLIMGKEVTPACAKSLQRFVCASAFPECASAGLAAPVAPVCRSLCREAERDCDFSLSCDFLQSKDCTAAVEDGFFVLKDDQGPYEPLPYLYGVLLLVWSGLTCLWLYQTFVRHSHGGSRLCRLLTCVPLAKMSMMMLSLAFWSTCVRWGYCSFWMGVSLINCQLMYETFSLIGFVLIAKGWCVTRPHFHPSEWRSVIILMCSFYLASSSLLLIRRIVLSSVVFWLCTGLLYGSAYAYVLLNVQDRLKSIRRSMGQVLQEQAHHLGVVMAEYQMLSVLLCVFCITEMFFCLLPLVHHLDLSFLPPSCQAFLQAIAQLDARLWLTLIVHELVEIGVLFLVGCLFRPRLPSPSTFWPYIEFDPSEHEPPRAGRPPPLYLIPAYDIGQPAKPLATPPLLSPRDLQLVALASARARWRGRGRADGLPPPESMADFGLLHGSGVTGAGDTGNAAQRLMDEQEEMQVRKASLAYQASRFLVVSQPGGAYAVAVPERLR